jgi:hypothetical protein
MSHDRPSAADRRVSRRERIVEAHAQALFKLWTATPPAALARFCVLLRDHEAKEAPIHAPKTPRAASS